MVSLPFEEPFEATLPSQFRGGSLGQLNGAARAPAPRDGRHGAHRGRADGRLAAAADHQTFCEIKDEAELWRGVPLSEV